MDPELEALLSPRRIERIAPPEVRARALARARAIVAAGGRIPPRSSLELVAPPPAMPVPTRGLTRLVVPASFAAAAAALAIGAVGAIGSSPARPPALSPSARLPIAAAVQPVEAAPTEVQAAPTPLVTSAKPGPGAARAEREVGPSELELLGRAQAAYTHHEFARAIGLLAELTRRFPNGHLAEEREALRVRSLYGMGSADEARRAAAAFAHRFPRSVLLPKEGKP